MRLIDADALNGYKFGLISPYAQNLFHKTINEAPTIVPEQNEQWQELKETIIELRDNDGTGTQQEVCKFLSNLMDILEKQISQKVRSKYGNI